MNSKLKKARVGNVFHLISFFLMLLGVPNAGVSQDSKVGIGNMDKSVVKSEQEWKGCLTSEEYRILREKGTEMAFTGKYNKHNEDGVYKCAGCGEELFSSETKYDSGSGWPSFWKPISDNKVSTDSDKSMFMARTEILCHRCGGHLGHVFDDGPQPTGLRYCVNSVSLDFEAKSTVTVDNQKEDKK